MTNDCNCQPTTHHDNGTRTSGADPECPRKGNFDAWIETHCYSCGGRTDQPGPEDESHERCFTG